MEDLNHQISKKNLQLNILMSEKEVFNKIFEKFIEKYKIINMDEKTNILIKNIFNEEKYKNICFEQLEKYILSKAKEQLNTTEVVQTSFFESFSLQTENIKTQKFNEFFEYLIKNFFFRH